MTDAVMDTVLGRARNNIMAAWRAPLVPARHGKAPYLWIFSLAFLLWKYVYVRPSTLELLALVATLLLFLPIYFFSFRSQGKPAMLCVALTCLLGALWAPHNLGANTFFIFAGAMCAAVLPVRLAYAMLGAVLFTAGVVVINIDYGHLNFLLPTLAVGLPVGLASIMDASLRRSREQLLRTQEEVEHMATIAERERISRDLHDLLGHTLSLITLKAELAGKLLARDPAACRSEISDIEHSARNALAEVRSAVSGYREAGLVQALAAARSSLAAAGVTLSTDVAPLSLRPAVENVLALAVREAATNILRHAGATRCDLRLVPEGGMVLLRIADNGTAARTIKPGNGLAFMRTRVETQGGTLGWHVDGGLTLELALPMKEIDAEERKGNDVEKTETVRTST